MKKTTVSLNFPSLRSLKSYVDPENIGTRRVKGITVFARGPRPIFGNFIILYMGI